LLAQVDKRLHEENVQAQNQLAERAKKEAAAARYVSEYKQAEAAAKEAGKR